METDLKDPKNWKWETLAVVALTLVLWVTQPYGIVESLVRSILTLVSIVVVVFAFVALMAFTGVIEFRDGLQVDVGLFRYEK